MQAWHFEKVRMQVIKEDPRIISFQTLRKTVGWLGICLPLALVLGTAIAGNCIHLQDTISHYYYTASGDLFVGVLCAVALFLFCYKGYEGDSDHFWTSLAGFLALCIAFFPTNNNSADACAVIHLPDNALRRFIHYVSAAAFFLILAGISLFLFTRSKGETTREKKLRNQIYITCGLVILAAIISIAIYGLVKGESRWGRYKPVFWLEWVALFAFGVSWLVKGQIVLKDHSLGANEDQKHA
jgi:hypothetical protein